MKNKYVVAGGSITVESEYDAIDQVIEDNLVADMEEFILNGLEDVRASVLTKFGEHYNGKLTVKVSM